jgi:hypothetical protein
MSPYDVLSTSSEVSRIFVQKTGWISAKPYPPASQDGHSLDDVFRACQLVYLRYIHHVVAGSLAAQFSLCFQDRLTWLNL